MKLRNFVAAVAVANLAALAAYAPAWAKDLDLLTPQGHVTLAPGERMMDAMNRAGTVQRIQQLKADWRASHGASAIPNTQPQILTGNVVSNTLLVNTPSSVPVLQFRYTTSKAGLSAAQFEFISPNGQDGLLMDYYQGAYSTKGNIVFAGQNTAPYFIQPGKWTLSQAIIMDLAGNYTLYDAAQLAALFQNPALTVVDNGPVDFTPPVVTSGKILTPKISLSSPLPQFRATISAKDAVSGVALGYVYIQAPGASYGNTQPTFAPFSFKSGNLEVAVNLYSFQPAGTWTILGYQVCDVAENCFETESIADVKALFGTTIFTVTQ